MQGIRLLVIAALFGIRAEHAEAVDAAPAHVLELKEHDQVGEEIVVQLMSEVRSALKARSQAGSVERVRLIARFFGGPNHIHMILERESGARSVRIARNLPRDRPETWSEDIAVVVAELIPAVGTPHEPVAQVVPLFVPLSASQPVPYGKESNAFRYVLISVGAAAALTSIGFGVSYSIAEAELVGQRYTAAEHQELNSRLNRDGILVQACIGAVVLTYGVLLLTYVLDD